MPPGPRRIIAARACLEIQKNAIVNLGIGLPEDLGKIAAEWNTINDFTLTVESGPIGGVPAGGLSFGAAHRPQAVIDQPAQFDFYDGGGLDFAALGAAQIDQQGNVNVSKFAHKLPGCGGFINITQTAKKIVFCGTMTAAGLKIDVQPNALRILQEGAIPKFVKNVDQITFSAQRARQNQQEVLYITERAVFKLHPQGLELIEVAPAIDIQTQIIDIMAFKPIIKKPKTMPKKVFQ